MLQSGGEDYPEKIGGRKYLRTGARTLARLRRTRKHVERPLDLIQREGQGKWLVEELQSEKYKDDDENFYTRKGWFRNRLELGNLGETLLS